MTADQHSKKFQEFIQQNIKLQLEQNLKLRIVFGFGGDVDEHLMDGNIVDLHHDDAT
jgi:hypothetical protein